MRQNQFVIGVVIGLSLAVIAGRVEAKDKQFHASFTGTFTNKDDLSFTGTQGFLSLLADKSTLGAYTVQIVAENPPDGKTCTPPGGGSGAEIGFVGEVAVLSFSERGDQLFLRLSTSVPSNGCFNLTTTVFTGQTTLDVIGGTGRFEGATGTIVKTFQTITLGPVPPPSGKGAFGSFTGTFDGTIELAK